MGFVCRQFVTTVLGRVDSDEILGAVGCGLNVHEIGKWVFQIVTAVKGGGVHISEN